MEMQQTQSAEHVCISEFIDHFYQLGCRKAELGAITAGIFPFTMTGRSQTAAQSDQRFNTEPFRGLNNHIQFIGFLDHDKHLFTHLATDHGQLDKLAIFVTVTDN